MRSPGPSLVDLRELRGADLLPVLEAQAAYWRARFWWDLGPAIGEMRKMLDRRTLPGRAVVCDGRPEGYCYFVPRGRTATVGDLFILRNGRERGGIERRLLESALNDAALQPGVKRVQGQLLSLRALPGLCPALLGTLRIFPRQLMLARGLGPAPGRGACLEGLRFSQWSERDGEGAAELIAEAYRGHVDAHVNELYGSVEGARNLVSRLTARTGPTWFFPPASVVARNSGKISLAGMAMGSLVGAGVGHVLQLCVAPAEQGRGLGSELLRRSLAAFARAGCGAVSLTVTRSNRKAVGFYERRGFRSIATFPAFVWERI